MDRNRAKNNIKNTPKIEDETESKLEEAAAAFLLFGGAVGG